MFPKSFHKFSKFAFRLDDLLIFTYFFKKSLSGFLFFLVSGVGGVGIKLTFLLFYTFDFFVTTGGLGWLMKASKYDFGAPK